jgi:hypothetical protein
VAARDGTARAAVTVTLKPDEIKYTPDRQPEFNRIAAKIHGTTPRRTQLSTTD